MVVLWSKSCRANGVYWPSSHRAARLLIGGVPVVSYKAAAGADLAADFPLGLVWGYQAGGTITAALLLHTPANSGNHAFRLNFAAVKAGEDVSAGPTFSGTNVDFGATAVPAVANQLARVTVEVPIAALDSFVDGDELTARLTLLDSASTCASAIYVRELNLRQEL